ncbi:unnamed protein product, partial [Amoebophrya sp. A25]
PASGRGPTGEHKNSAAGTGKKSANDIKAKKKPKAAGAAGDEDDAEAREGDDRLIGRAVFCRFLLASRLCLDYEDWPNFPSKRFLKVLPQRAPSPWRRRRNSPHRPTSATRKNPHGGMQGAAVALDFGTPSNKGSPSKKDTAADKDNYDTAGAAAEEPSEEELLQREREKREREQLRNERNLAQLLPADKIFFDRIGADRFFETTIPEVPCRLGLSYLELVLRFDAHSAKLGHSPTPPWGTVMTVRQCADWLERVLLTWVVVNKKRTTTMQAAEKKANEQAAGGTSKLGLQQGGLSSTELADSKSGHLNGGAKLVVNGGEKGATQVGVDMIKRVERYKSELRQFFEIMLPAASLVADQRRERLEVIKRRVQLLRDKQEPVMWDLKTDIEGREQPPDVISNLAAQSSFFDIPPEMRGEMSRGEFQRQMLKLCQTARWDLDTSRDAKDLTKRMMQRTFAVVNGEAAACMLIEPEALIISQYLTQHA